MPRPEYNGATIPLLAHYIGNLDANSFADYLVNTDDQPIIEYRAPIVNQNANARLITYFTGANLIRYFAQNNQVFPYHEDTFLAELPPHVSLLTQAGLHLHRKGVLEWRQQYYLAEAAYQLFEIAYKHSIAGGVPEKFQMRSK